MKVAAQEGGLPDSKESVMQKWVATATQLVTTQAAEIKNKGTEGVGERLKAELENFLKQICLQERQLTMEDRNIRELQKKISVISDIKNFEKLQTDLKALKAEIVPAKKPPQTLLAALEAWKAELYQWKQSKQKIMVTSALREKYGLFIKQVESKQGEFQDLCEQLTVDWEAHRAVQSCIEKTLTEIEQSFQGIGFVKTGVSEIHEQLKGLETEEGEQKKQLTKLQTKLADWLKELEQKKQPQPSSVEECFKEAYTIYGQQQKDIRSVQAEEGDEDNLLASTIVEIDKRIETLNTIEKRFSLYAQIMKDKEKPLTSSGNPFRLKARQLERKPPDQKTARQLERKPSDQKTVEQTAVNELLKHVAEGEQDKAEKMLEKNPELLLSPGIVTDLSERKFEKVTAFQYALWAMDWRMWEMIQGYLPEEEQAKQFSIWNSKEGKDLPHGKHFSLQPLIDELQIYVDQADKVWNYDQQATDHWCKKVGGQQKRLPAHVVNEYCYPRRSFDPCPEFKEKVLPRSRICEICDNSEWVERQWFTSYKERVLGVDFAVFRGERYVTAVACGTPPCERRWFSQRVKIDLTSLQALSKVCAEQLELLRLQLMAPPPSFSARERGSSLEL
jgi:hypothetical protein